MKMRGFTLIELLMVIAIAGVLAAALTVFLQPAIQGYLDTRRRADLSDMADTALRLMAQDIRSAVPNSIIWHGGTCFQLVPTSGGGRYRMGRDLTMPIPQGNLVLDSTTSSTGFDVFNFMNPQPNPGDWVVINNQNANDVYAGANRVVIAGVQTPPFPGGVGAGQHRITFAATQFSQGYTGGRFVIVPAATPSIFYTLVGTNLRRVVAGFNTLAGAGCVGAGAGVISAADVATNVTAAVFTYNPNQGATQQSGFLEMQLALGADGDNVTLTYGIHVENLP